MIFVLGSGSYWVALFDSYAGSFPLITVALFESISIGWVYGVDRLVLLFVYIDRIFKGEIKETIALFYRVISNYYTLLL